jgi:hypothetical protein
VVVTAVILPARMGAKHERSGSAFSWMATSCLREHRYSILEEGVDTSGCCFATMLGALLFSSCRSVSENSECVARDGWTETMTSLARWAMRATRRRELSQCMFLSSCTGAQSAVSRCGGGAAGRTYQLLRQS